MCGRFEIHSPLEIIARLFGIDPRDVLPFAPNYNVAPGQPIPLIVMQERKRIIAGRWGFIPAWAKEEKAGYSMINARAETVSEKPAFRQAFRTSRCLVPADGFFEWQQTASGKKPAYIHLKTGGIMLFAGLYSDWIGPDGKSVTTCTIIVTDANELLAPLHDRMPVILRPEDADGWLDPGRHAPATLQSLLKSYPAAELSWHYVSPQVNAAKNNFPDLLQPV